MVFDIKVVPIFILHLQMTNNNISGPSIIFLIFKYYSSSSTNLEGNGGILYKSKAFEIKLK